MSLSPDLTASSLLSPADDLQRCGHRAVHHRLRDVRGRRAADVLAAVGLQPQSRRLREYRWAGEGRGAGAATVVTRGVCSSSSSSPVSQ